MAWAPLENPAKKSWTRIRDLFFSNLGSPPTHRIPRMAKERGKKRGRAQLNDDLTALLRKWDLEDAAEALAEGGWKSVSRLKKMEDQDVGELGLPRGTARELEELLRSLRKAESKEDEDKAARIRSLEQEVAKKDERIRALEQKGAEKDKRIRELEREAKSQSGGNKGGAKKAGEDDVTIQKVTSVNGEDSLHASMSNSAARI